MRGGSGNELPANWTALDTEEAGVATDVPQELLQQFCADLRLMWLEAGGPSLRALSREVRRSKSQVGNILNGRIRQPPGWDVVQAMLTGFVHHAREQGRSSQLSQSTGVIEYWRPRLAVVEHAFGNARRAHRPAAASPAGLGGRPGDPAVPPATPRQLPAATRHFAGRAAQLTALTGLAKATEEIGGTVVICAIHGTAGVGKTTLAVHWAHRAAEWFPDGQLYVNLRGFDPAGPPMEPADALRGFLDALRVPAEQIPSGVDAQATMFRTMLAERRMLVVLDNARDAEQARPLLPAASRCLVLITSRNQLSSLVAVEGAHPVTLDLLPPAEARELLARRLGAARVSADPAAVDEIITRCARLPLALAVVSARAVTYPDFPLATLADELRDVHRSQLSAFDGGDTVSDVRAVFSWSYQGISPSAARLFRLLGLHPGPDAGLRAVGSLAGEPADRARRLAAELAQANLVSEHVPGRFILHDLLRAYAAELTERLDPDAERLAARERMLDHYLGTAYAVSELLDPHRGEVRLRPVRPGVVADDVTDVGAAEAWFRTEYRTLLSVVAQAAAHGLDTHAWQIGWAVGGFLHRCGHWQDNVAVQRIAVEAARRTGDRAGEASTQCGLGQAYGQLTRYAAGHAAFRSALALFEQLGDRAGRARAHLGLSWIHECLGRRDEALRHGRLGLDLFQEIGHRAGEARALNVVGWRLAQLGRHRDALEYCQRAIPLLRDSGDRYALAATWDTLGFAHHHLGDFPRAAACYRQAIALCREAGDRYDEAMFLGHLGDTHHAAGAPKRARQAWARAAEILVELRHQDAAAVRAKLATLPEPD
jgi:tetratricopeptide (TPR) repeat protein